VPKNYRRDWAIKFILQAFVINVSCTDHCLFC
jgi:hypothetical protein